LIIYNVNTNSSDENAVQQNFKIIVISPIVIDFSNKNSVSICFAYENGTFIILDKCNKIIHIVIDQLFYKQTSPKFHLGKSCPVL
jgi:hypothetical protein